MLAAQVAAIIEIATEARQMPGLASSGVEPGAVQGVALPK
jgi:hypothetical protein